MAQIIEFFKQNLGTIAVLLLLACVLALIIIRMIRDKRRGVPSCSCGCSSCPMSGKCHANDNSKT